jgi:hypothetical protein
MMKRPALPRLVTLSNIRNHNLLIPIHNLIPILGNRINPLETVPEPELSKRVHAPGLKKLPDDAVGFREVSFDEDNATARAQPRMPAPTMMASGSSVVMVGG